MSANQELEALQTWYRSQCDGDWEHTYGVKIETLDNPGWAVLVDLELTELQDRPFSAVQLERSEADWIHARVRDQKWEAFGGPLNLPEMLALFNSWAGQVESEH
jgi:hypothetical protein